MQVKTTRHLPPPELVAGGEPSTWRIAAVGFCRPNGNQGLHVGIRCTANRWRQCGQIDPQLSVGFSFCGMIGECALCHFRILEPNCILHIEIAADELSKVSPTTLQFAVGLRLWNALSGDAWQHERSSFQTGVIEPQSQLVEPGSCWSSP